MADKKKGKQRKAEEEKPTKEEYAVAKYLRFNLPVREGKLHGMEVKCFFGNAAVDKLMVSKWSAANAKKDAPLFTNRQSCVLFMVRLLKMGLFHRAEREPRKRDKDKDKLRKKRKDKDGEKEEPVSGEEEVRERRVKKDKKRKEKEADVNAADDEAEKKDGEKKIEKKEDRKKKEKRLKLMMPEEQFFEDKDEIFVWIYDPVNAKTFLIGLLMVLGAIALCMFPLWPEEVRIGVYYLSIAMAGFVGFILSLVVVRLILFCLIWTITLGKHHFWLLPNLTEDVGFFDSFRPLYKHELVSKSPESKSESTESSKKKQAKNKKEGQEQQAAGKKSKSSDRDDSDEFEVIKKEELDINGAKDNQEHDTTADDTLSGDKENDNDNDNGVEDEDLEEEEDDDLDEGEDRDDEEEDEDGSLLTDESENKKK